jgi:hypothetical protein
MKMENGKVWIGLATVSALSSDNDLNGAKGASFNVLHFANNKDEFKEKVTNQLFEYGYSLEELEDISLFNFDLSYQDNLNKLATITKESHRLQWGTFYTFDE